MADNEKPEMIEIPSAELKTLRALADGLTAQNALVLLGQKDNSEIMKALLVELGKQETLVIPAPEVTVKAANVTIPPAPAPVVQMMPAEKEDRLKKYHIVRDRMGAITDIEESYK